MDEVYRERNALVAFICKEWGGFFREDSPDEPGWGIAWFYDYRAGQLSWHIPPSDFDLFDGVPAHSNFKWDNHTTEEKYERLRRLGDEILHADDGIEW